MVISLLSGSVINAGDYLITKRSQELLSMIYPDSEQRLFIRNNPLSSSQFETMNKSDIIIFTGGPYYKINFYPPALPENLEDVKPKIFMLGGGWWGRTQNDSEIWNYKIRNSSLKLFRRAITDTGKLGCRDNATLLALSANGINQYIMTGCPAWYDSEKICLRMDSSREINKIMLSDPANMKLYGGQALEIARYVRKKFYGSEIHYIFHRTLGDLCFKSELEKLNITYHDIGGSSEGFQLYNDCDLHIGYRVHAHIYNLSQRNPSILIEEDSRGAGVNQTLGLFGIKAYSDLRKGNSKFTLERLAQKFRINRILVNNYCINDLDVWIDYMSETNFRTFNFTFSKMEYYFDVILSHIKTIENYI